jgi:hypothetical protein
VGPVYSSIVVSKVVTENVRVPQDKHRKALPNRVMTCDSDSMAAWIRIREASKRAKKEGKPHPKGR